MKTNAIIGRTDQILDKNGKTLDKVINKSGGENKETKVVDLGTVEINESDVSSGSISKTDSTLKPLMDDLKLTDIARIELKVALTGGGTQSRSYLLTPQYYINNKCVIVGAPVIIHDNEKAIFFALMSESL